MEPWPLWKVVLVDHLWWTLVNGFCVSLVLPAVLVVLGLILANRFGRGLGFPLLLWVPRAGGGRNWGQFAVGAGIGVLLWQVFLAGFISEEFVTTSAWDHPPFCEVRPPYTGGTESGPFPGRFRYPPDSVLSVWRYAWVVVGGIGVLVLLAVAAVAVVQVVTWRSPAPFAARWKPFYRTHDASDPPYSAWLPLGVAAGLLVMTAVAWAALEGPAREIAATTGRTMLWSGGHGLAAGRQERVEKAVAATREGRDPVPWELDSAFQAGRNARRAWLAPYAPAYGLFLLAFFGVALVTAALAVIDPRVRLLSPAAWIIFLLHLGVTASVVTSQFVPFSGQFVVVVLILLAIFAGRSYKLRFPNLPFGEGPVLLEDAYKRMAEADTKPRPADDPAVQTADLAYVRRDARGALKPPLALVCASGGGSRAALWTMSVLARLERAFLAGAGGRPPVAFPYHVRLVTGASGGMLAGAAYVCSLDTPSPGGTDGLPPVAIRRYIPPGASAPPELDDLVAASGENFLNAAAHQLGWADLWSIFFPARLKEDRGWAIERAWRAAFGGLLDRTFDDLRLGEQAGWRPSLIFSPMLIEDGRQLFVSNLSLRAVTQNRARVIGSDDDLTLISREGVEFFELFPEARRAFQVGTAVRMSASFPYLLPATPLPTNPPRRVVDAGYYDNFGVGIAVSWLANHLDWVRANTSGVVLIQIRDGESEASRRREEVTDSFPSLIDRGLQWATSPPEGLWQSRAAANVFRNDSLLYLVTQLLRARGFPPDFFATSTFELVRGEDVSLSFSLTPEERRWVTEGAASPAVTKRVESVVDWWHARLASPEARNPAG
jgi:predicted acylesterase/phospholipase RssA